MIAPQADGDADALRDEVARLKTQHGTLRARVAQLEDSLAQARVSFSRTQEFCRSLSLSLCNHLHI